MLENDLFTLIISTIQAGLTANGMPDIKIKQSYQSTQQGTNTAPTLYLNKLFDKLYGNPEKKNEWDPDTVTMVNTQTQFYESPFQGMAIATQDPSNLSAPTATDIANLAANILQSDSTIQTLRASGVGIQKITQVRKPQFIDDRNRFEAGPNFDFTVTWEQDILSTTPIVETFEYDIERV